MSLASADGSRDPPSGAPRPGRITCFCPAAEPVEGERRGLLALAGGFAASVLAQTLTLGLLPLAGLLLAPRPALAPAPAVAMLLGAALATFPASLLLDAFGRRASFALGASHGVAGSAILAWGLSQQAFAPVCLGAFWIGVAQGFSLFYRHEAAIGASPSQRMLSVGVVFGSGALAGLAGPYAADLAQTLAPGFYVGTALAAGLAQLLALVIAAASARRHPVRVRSTAARAPDWRAMVAPTLVGVLAWFAMNLLMLAAPFSMVGCGVAATGVVGAIAWHVVAMYAPALVTAPLSGRLNPRWVAALGLLSIVTAIGVFAGAQDALRFTTSLVLLAIGWSFATTAATAWLHDDARPTRLMLAVHDAALFAAAIAGALAAFPFAPR